MEFLIMELNKAIATPMGVRYEHNFSVIILFFGLKVLESFKRPPLCFEIKLNVKMKNF